MLQNPPPKKPAPPQNDALVAAQRIKADALSLVGVTKKFTKEDIETFFRTYARECITTEERKLFLYQCELLNLDPRKKEIYATGRYVKVKNENGSDTGRKEHVVEFIVAEHVVRARTQAQDWQIKACGVYENEDFIFDHLAGIPTLHVYNSAKHKTRGKLVYVWAIAKPVGRKKADGYEAVGQMFRIAELLKMWNDGNLQNPVANQMPEHMAIKVARVRIAKAVCPDISNIISEDETGITIQERVNYEPGRTEPNPDPEQAPAETETVGEQITDADFTVQEQQPDPQPEQQPEPDPEQSDPEPDPGPQPEVKEEQQSAEDAERLRKQKLSKIAGFLKNSTEVAYNGGMASIQKIATAKANAMLTKHSAKTVSTMSDAGLDELIAQVEQFIS